MIAIKKFKLFKEIDTGKDLVHLDDLVIASGVNPVTFPSTWYQDEGSLVVISWTDCLIPWSLLRYTLSISGTNIVCTIHSEDWENLVGTGTKTIAMGKKYTSLYEPSIIYRKDSGLRHNGTGSAFIRNKIRITNIYLSVSNSYSASMQKFGLGIESTWQTHTAVALDVNDYRKFPNFTGDWDYYFSEDMANASMIFQTDSHLGLTIDEISWEGQYHQVGKPL